MAHLIALFDFHLRGMIRGADLGANSSGTDDV